MKITWSFFILIPCLIMLLTRRTSYSLWVLSFFASFSATAAVNFTGLNESGAGISLSWFGLLFVSIIYYFRRNNHYKRDWNRKSLFVNNSCLLMYWLIVIAGLVSLNELVIEAENLDELVFKNPGMDATNLARYIFLTLGLFFVYQFSNKATSKEVIIILDCMIFGTTAACVIGLITYFSDSYILAEIFNTNISKFAQGYTAEGKISGPSVEPSILIQTIGISISILLVKMRSQNLKHNKNNFTLLFCMVVQFVTLVLSNAHSSIPVLLALIIQVLIFSGSMLFKFIMLTCIPLMLIPYLVTLEEKISTFSGLERLGSILYSYEIFLTRPIIGFGFAEVTTHDLIVNSLANTGVFATILLFALPVSSVIAMYRNRIKLKSVYVLSAPFAALLNLFFVMSFSGFSHPFTFLYICVAVGLWVNNRLGIKFSGFSKKYHILN